MITTPPQDKADRELHRDVHALLDNVTDDLIEQLIAIREHQPHPDGIDCSFGFRMIKAHAIEVCSKDIKTCVLLDDTSQVKRILRDIEYLTQAEL